MDVKPQEAIASFVAFIFSAVRIAGYFIERRKKADLEAAARIPPTVTPAPADVDLQIVRLELATRETELSRLRWELDDARKTLKDVSEDQARTAAELAAERRRSTVLRDENARLRASIAAGRWMPVQVVEEDDRVTDRPPRTDDDTRPNRPLTRRT